MEKKNENIEMWKKTGEILQCMKEGLISAGFTQEEAHDMVKSTFNQLTNPASLMAVRESIMKKFNPIKEGSMN